jgi:metal-responsive CopG/Arc/MetJ family transcriptional regulator
VKKNGLEKKFKKKITDTHINEFKKVYQSRSNLIKVVNYDLLAYFRNILNRWKKYFCQLLIVHDINDGRQKGIQLNHQYMNIVSLRCKLLSKI